MKRAIASVALFVTVLGLGSQGQAAVLFSDNFDTDNATSALNFNSLNNWTVSDGTIDYIRSGGFGIDCVGNTGGCLDMDGSTSNAGRITSTATFAMVADVVYTFEAQVSGNQRGGASDTLTFGLIDAISNVELASVTFGPLAFNETFQTLTVNLISGGPLSVRLFIEGAGNDNVGAILDNVVFRDDTDSETVPVPATLALLGLGLAGLGYGRRRKTAT